MNLAPVIEPISEILRVLKDVGDAKRPQDLLNSILDRVLVVAKASRVEIALWDAKESRLKIVALRGKRPNAGCDVGDNIPLNGMIMKAWQQHDAKPVAERHPISGKNYHQVDKRTQAEAVFRLHRHGAKFGILNIEWFNRKYLTDARLANLTLLSEQAALALTIVDHNKLLAEFASGLAAKHDISNSICRVLEGIRESYGFDRLLVYQADVRRRCLDARFVLTSRKAREVKNKPWSYKFDECSLAVHSFNTRRTRYLSDPWHSKHKEYVNHKGLREYNIRGPILALPLMYSGKPIGSFVVWSQNDSKLTENVKYALRPIADLIAAYLGSNTETGGHFVPLDLLKSVLLESQRATSTDAAITTILHAVQAFGFDRARYLRYDITSKSFIRGSQLVIGESPRDNHVVIDARKSPYAAHIANTFHQNPNARVFDPRSPDWFGVDPDYKRLGKSRYTPWIAVPIALQGRLIGQLAADNEKSKRDIPPMASHFMTLTAGIAALVLSRLSEIDFSLINTLPIAMFRKDINGLFLSVNERFATNLGKSIEQVKGRSDYDFYSETLADNFRKDDERVMRNKKVDQWVEETVCRNRRTFVHVVKSPVLDATKQVVGVQGLYLDEPYRAIFENSTEGIFRSTPDGKYIDVNGAWARLLGYESREELLKANIDIGKRVYASAHDRDYFRDKIKRNKGSIANFEYYIRRKDDSQIKVSEHSWEIRDSNNRLLYYEGIVRDISSQIKASAAVSKAQTKGLLKSLAQEVAHDIGHILDNICDDAEYLSSSLKSINAPGINSIHYKKCDHLTSMIHQTRDILNAYKRGERKNIYDPAQLRDCVREAIETMNPSLMAAGFSRPIISPSKFDAHLSIPKVELLQVLLNLIFNSIEAAKRNNVKMGSIKVTMRTRRAETRQSRSTVILRYEDNAGGMNEQTLQSLFRRDGTGRGMLVLSKIVDSYAGTVSVTSTLRKGSRFEISLPLHEMNKKTS